MSRVAAAEVGRAAPSGRVVAFDVDGTLTTRDCVVPFLRTLAGTLSLSVGLACHFRRLVPAVRRRERDTLKALATEVAFGGRRVDEVDTVARSFALRVIGEWIRPDTFAVLNAHKAAGATVVLVSASYGVYLRPFAEHLGIDHVIATEVEHNGVVHSGRLLGGNCRGAEKRRRLHAWLDAERGGRANVELWAYGDSAGDAELLADADHSVWVVADRSVALP